MNEIDLTQVDADGQWYPRLHDIPQWMVWKNRPLSTNSIGHCTPAKWELPIEERKEGLFATLFEAETYFGVQLDLSLKNRWANGSHIIWEFPLGDDFYTVLIIGVPSTCDQIERALEFYSKALADHLAWDAKFNFRGSQKDSHEKT